MEIKIKIAPIIVKGIMQGVKYEINNKLYSHEEVSKMLFNLGVSALMKEVNNHGYNTDDNGYPRYDIWVFWFFICFHCDIVRFLSNT